MNHEFKIKVYQYAPTVGQAFQKRIADWSGRTKDLTFGTKNPGGFATCTFRVDMPFAEAMDVYSNYHHFFINISGGNGEKAWQGRIENIMAEPGQATISAYGLWANAFDDFYDDGSLIPTPMAENSVVNLTDYAPFDSTKHKYAQSFTIAEERALQDVQIRLAKYGMEDGAIHVEVREDTVDGTLLGSNYILVKNLTNDGLSEFIGITTESKLDPLKTYWIVIYADGDCVGASSILTGTDNGGTSGRGYLIDTTRCWLSEGITAGVALTNTTQTYTVNVSDSDLSGFATPNKQHMWWWDNSYGWVLINEIKDGLTTTEHTFSNFDYAADYIYIGHNSMFGGIRVWPGTTPQAAAAEISVSYLVSGKWVEVTGLVDGTSVNGATLGQLGNIRWAIPEDWSYIKLPDRSSDKGYWIKIVFRSAVSTTFTIAEVNVGFNYILNFSNMGTNVWNNGDGYSTSKAAGLGRDADANYGGGQLQYYDGASWNAYGDAIFYVWPHPKFYYSEDDTTYAADVIEDVISECTFIRDDTFFFDDTGAVVNPIRFTNEEKHGNAIEKVVGFGSSGANPVPLFFGVYEDGYSYLRTFEGGSRWYVDAKSLPMGQQAMSLTSDLKGYKTRTAVLYSDQVGSRVLTSWFTNQELADQFGYHRSGLYSIAGANEGVAEIISDVVADVYSLPEQTLEIMIEGHVTDRAGNKWPAWMVRAGDIIEIRNLLPSGTVFSTELEERLKTLYVQETSYDAERARLVVIPTDKTLAMLDIILALAGLSGGSMK